MYTFVLLVYLGVDRKLIEDTTSEDRVVAYCVPKKLGIKE
mgnify:CR=1 FL=1